MHRPYTARIKSNNIKTLPDLFRARVDNSPKKVAYRTFNHIQNDWQSHAWVDIFRRYIQTRDRLAMENLAVGERILISLPNGIEWIIIEQAALSLGLVVVAISPTSLTAHMAFVADDCDASIIFIDTDSHVQNNSDNTNGFESTVKIISLSQSIDPHTEITNFQHWLSEYTRHDYELPNISEETLASIVYTSGTTGKPKGVMLSHKSMLNNAYACVEKTELNENDQLLSITPIAHIMERIAGYYTPMISGASITFSDKPGDVVAELKSSNANIMITTPHIIECAYQQLLAQNPFIAKNIQQYIDYKTGQGKFKFSFIFWPIINKILNQAIRKTFIGAVQKIYCGGTVISAEVKMLCTLLNIPIYIGYGLTEAGGIVAISDSRRADYGAGQPLTNVEITIDDDGELLINSDSLMMGYWNKHAINLDQSVIQTLSTEDIALIDNNNLHIIGRKSQLIHLTTGNKISPESIENHLSLDRLFDKVALFGEGKNKLTVICQLNKEQWRSFVKQHQSFENIEKQQSLLSVRINTLLKSLPGHHFIDFIIPTIEDWNSENGLVNELGKINRANVGLHYRNEIEEFYRGVYVK